MNRRTTWRNGPRLLRRFTLISLSVIGAFALVLSVVISHYLRKDLLERESRITADYTRTLALQHLDPADFAAPMTTQARERFRTLYAYAVMMPETIRVKIHDASMEIVWSDEPRLIGQRFPGNVDLSSALAGRTTVNLPIAPKADNLYERAHVGPLVEVYVPIVFPGTTRVAGVVETYKLPHQVFANIRRGQLAVAVTALAGGALLYVSLFSIFRLAARRIEVQRALTAHLQAVREQDRAAIATEAREELAQLLAALKIDLAWMVAELGDERPALRAKAMEMGTVLDAAVTSALRIAGEARPAVLDNLGLAVALEEEAKRFQARTGIRCRLTAAGKEFDLDPEDRAVVFRIAEEILTNVARHAGATRVAIDLKREVDGLRLTVEDDGRGITDREIADSASLGLLAMRERALLLGGELHITGARGGGTSVALTVPFKHPPSRPAGQ